MTGKLIKFEFRSGFRLLLVIWAALLAMTVLMCIMVSVTGLNSYSLFVQSQAALEIISSIIQVISWILYIGLFASLIVLTIAMVIARFYRGLLGDEGYLMHTLPVKVWQLITAKGITAGCAVIGSGLVGLISILVICTVGGAAGVREVFGEIFRAFGEHPVLILLAFEMLILGLAGILKTIYQIYAAIAIGQLASRHRILASLGAYLGICVVIMILAGILMFIGSITGIGPAFGEWMESHVAIITGDGLTGFGPSQVVMLLIFLGTAIQLVAFHVVAERLMTKRLNLL